jgi:hypothetical protein
MSKQRTLGTDHENKVRDHLNAPELFDGRISREDFSSPLGDLKGTNATIECKNQGAFTPSAWLKQVNKSDLKTGWGMPVVIAKKRQANIKDAYFITDLEHGAQLLLAWEICQKRRLM